MQITLFVPFWRCKCTCECHFRSFVAANNKYVILVWVYGFILPYTQLDGEYNILMPNTRLGYYNLYVLDVFMCPLWT